MFRRHSVLEEMARDGYSEELASSVRQAVRPSVDLVVEGHLFNNYEIRWPLDGEGPLSDHIRRNLRRISFSVEYMDAPSSMVPMVNYNEESQEFGLSMWHQYRAPLFVIGGSLVATNLMVALPISSALIHSQYSLAVVLTTAANTVSGIVSGLISYYFATRDGRQLKERRREDLPWRGKEVMKIIKSSKRVVDDPLIKDGLYTGSRWNRYIKAGRFDRDLVPFDMTIYALTAGDSIIVLETMLELGNETLGTYSMLKTHFDREGGQQPTWTVRQEQECLLSYTGGRKRIRHHAVDMASTNIRYADQL